MSSLAGKTLLSTYSSLLKLEGDTQTLVAGGGTAIQIKTGDNEGTPIYLNTDRVGIGTATPQSLLHVEGVADAMISVVAGGNSDASIRLTEQGALTGGAQITYDGSANALYIYSDGSLLGTPDIAIPRDTGNVGIGTATPLRQLQVSSTNTSVADSNQGCFAFYATSNYGGLTTIFSHRQDSNQIVVNEGGVDLDFRVEGVGVPSALHVQGSDGKVGIGTDDPDRRFHVEDTTSGVVAIFVGDTGSNYTAVDIGKEADGEIGMIRYRSSANSGWSVGSDGTNDEQFRFSRSFDSNLDNPRLVINTNGRVGIGTLAPKGTLTVAPVKYSIGTASQSLYVVTGSGTAWTLDMVGKEFVFKDGTGAGKITGFTDTTHLTVTTSETVSSQNYKIHYNSIHALTNGTVGIGTSAIFSDRSMTVGEGVCIGKAPVPGATVDPSKFTLGGGITWTADGTSSIVRFSPYSRYALLWIGRTGSHQFNMSSVYVSSGGIVGFQVINNLVIVIAADGGTSGNMIVSGLTDGSTYFMHMIGGNNLQPILVTP